jgi:hypothetical protein|tara:strand:+ start:7698 stop:8528 length:831 start_codon:yes stop_codon:yes gene_type:complete
MTGLLGALIRTGGRAGDKAITNLLIPVTYRYSVPATAAAVNKYPRVAAWALKKDMPMWSHPKYGPRITEEFLDRTLSPYGVKYKEAVKNPMLFSEVAAKKTNFPRNLDEMYERLAVRDFLFRRAMNLSSRKLPVKVNPDGTTGLKINSANFLRKKPGTKNTYVYNRRNERIARKQDFEAGDIARRHEDKLGTYVDTRYTYPRSQHSIMGHFEVDLEKKAFRDTWGVEWNPKDKMIYARLRAGKKGAQELEQIAILKLRKFLASRMKNVPTIEGKYR